MNTSADEEDRRNTVVARSTGEAERRIALTANRVESRDLFVGTREITIAHGADVYRLRLTAQNKLILTK